MAVAAALLLGALGDETDSGPPDHKTEGRDPLMISWLASASATGSFSFIANAMDGQVQIHDCSGVLIEADTVMVPASCVFSRNRRSNQTVFQLVRVGSFDLNEHVGDGPEEVSQVCEVSIHEAFDDPKNGHDVALLKLRHNITAHAPIVNATSIDDCPVGNLSALGFFALGPNGSPDRRLRVVPNFKWLPPEKCEPLMGNLPGRFCAIPNVSTNPAWDLGSLLLCNGNSLVGIASYKHSHMQNEYWPVVYSSAVELFAWVKSIPTGKPKVERNQDKECESFWEPTTRQNPDVRSDPDVQHEL